MGNSTTRPFPVEWALFFLALVVGAGLRFYALGDQPSGIYHDEAYYGLDALDVIDGARPIFFPANNGREPLYIYLLSLSLAAFGRSPFGLRLASATIGALTVPVTYLLGYALFNRRVGLLAMFICAVTFWPVALSRVSFRAGVLPLFLGLAVALGSLGLQRTNAWLSASGGIAYGLAFNTYTASRITPLAFLLTAGVAFFLYRGERRESQLPIANNVLLFAVAALIVVTPLGLYAFSHPDQVFARESQVSIFETEAGNPIWILIEHIGLGLGMFGFHGDTIARHNLPGRPVFDVLMFLAFLVGLWVTARRAPRRLNSAFILIWLAVTLLPTVAAEDTPHFLRGIGMLPILWLVPALGLEAIIDSPRLPAIQSQARYVLAALTLLVSFVFTTHDYFVRYVNDPLTRYYFESAATGLANEINSRPMYAARIDNRLWDNFAALRFLIADRDGAASSDRVQLAVWPYEPEAVREALAGLPLNSMISARAGALARGDLERTPYSLYTLYIAEPVGAEPVTARFGDSVELLGTQVVGSSDGVRIRLGWAVSRPVSVDYHVYVHVLVDGEIRAQSDGEPLGGVYHFSWLRPGDVLNDIYTLPVGGSIRVGLYAPDGTALGDPVMLK